MNANYWMTGGAVLVCGAATYWDLRERRIPNAVTLPALGLALCLHGATQAGQGLLLSALGAVVAGGLLLPGYLLRATGAGDVKLLMAVGALLGFSNGVIAALLSLIIGGFLSVVMAVKRKGLVDLLSRSVGLGRWLLLRSAGVPQLKPTTSGQGIPLGIAIALATVVVVFSHWFGPVR